MRISSHCANFWDCWYDFGIEVFGRCGAGVERCWSPDRCDAFADNGVWVWGPDFCDAFAYPGTGIGIGKEKVGEEGCYEYLY